MYHLKPRCSVKNISSLAVRYRPTIHLADGIHQLNYVPAMNKGVANLYTQDRPGRGVDDSPFSFGIMGSNEQVGPALKLQWCDTGLGFARVYPPEKWEMEEVIPIGFGENNAPETVRYRFEPSKNFAIRWAEVFDFRTGRLSTRVAATHFAKCSKGRWFPTRWVLVSEQVGPKGVMFKELKVTEFEVDKRPDADQLAISMKAGTEVIYRSDMSSIRLRQDERIRADQLPGLLDLIKKAKSNPQKDTAIPPPPQSFLQKYGVWCLSFGLSVFVFGMIAFVRRARRQPVVGENSLAPR